MTHSDRTEADDLRVNIRRMIGADDGPQEPPLKRTPLVLDQDHKVTQTQSKMPFARAVVAKPSGAYDSSGAEPPATPELAPEMALAIRHEVAAALDEILVPRLRQAVREELIAMLSATTPDKG